MQARKPVMVVAAVLAMMALLLFVLNDKPRAPELVLTTLDGKPLSLNSLRGKVVLVNFWATSCPGCVREMPQLAATHEKFQARGLVVVAVAMSYDAPEYVRNFTRQHRLPFVVALDVNGEAAKGFNQVKLTPTTFLIDRNGHIIQQTIGELDFPKLYSLLDQQLRNAT